MLYLIGTSFYKVLYIEFYLNYVLCNSTLGSDSWTSHNNSICPDKYIYGSNYSSVKKAQDACYVDSNCGFVNDIGCDGFESKQLSENFFNLCRQFSASDLKNSTHDCVYERPSNLFKF